MILQEWCVSIELSSTRDLKRICLDVPSWHVFPQETSLLGQIGGAFPRFHVQILETYITAVCYRTELCNRDIKIIVGYKSLHFVSLCFFPT